MGDNRKKEELDRRMSCRHSNTNWLNGNWEPKSQGDLSSGDHAVLFFFCFVFCIGMKYLGHTALREEDELKG